MDYRTFLRSAETMVAEFENDMQPRWARGIRSLLEHGEEGMAVDHLLRGLIENEIPVSPAQRDTLHDLVAYFPPPDGGWSRHVPYLMTAAIDWLIVVDDGTAD